MNIVIVGGCGHVGLPLGIVLADRGTQVTLLDIDAAKAATVNSGRMPFLEAGAQEMLARVVGKRLRATLDSDCLRTADVAVAVVGTPVDEHLNPTVNSIYKSIDRLVEEMRDDSLLVLRSTVYPGVTKLVHERIRSRGRNIHVAFCPERIAEGKAIEELVTLPQIVAAFEPEAAERARKLFLRLTKTIIELPPLEAELAKLFSNSWRYLNFAISNQYYCLAQSYGLDFYRIHDAVTRDYPRMRSFARAGFAAGPCLLKDTLQLSTFSGNSFFLGHAAMLVNEGLPNFIVSQLRAQGLSNKVVAILGMAFKSESDDKRDSLSYKLKKLLELEAAEVLCTDPYVPDASLVGLEEAIGRADIVILGAPHSVYRNLQIAAEKHIVDVWGFWREEAKRMSQRPGNERGTMKILVTGAAGFIAGYLIEELLQAGHEVVGLDNFSKYGPCAKSYDAHPRYKFVQGDAKDVALLKDLLAGCDHFVAGAAMIGGISYFHEFAYDLLAENERITASSFDAAIWAHANAQLQRMTVISSSMVFECTSEFPTSEGAQRRCPPPNSTYGFQKLATEYFAQGAFEQYKLPFTIVRPFNCVGTGEKRALCDREILSGNVKLAMSHVVPDLVQKVLKGQDPLHILGDGKQLRHYTYGGDLARGIRLCLESSAAVNEDFNLSTSVSTTVLELARLIWKKIHGSSKPFRYVSDPPFDYDVQFRSPETSKAERVLGFRATTSLEDILNEVIPWVAEQIEIGQI